MGIEENFLAVSERVAQAAARSGRNAEDISIVAVTKTHPAAVIDEAISAGIEHIGENRVQEALAKHGDVERQAVWHMVGHLQRNKVKHALSVFDSIHSVESIALATEINKRADRIVDIFTEVNIGEEESKSGIKTGEVIPFLKKLRPFENLRCRGLMAVPPIQDTSEYVRPFFRELAELQNEANRQNVLDHPLHDLSMGMTDDFEIAIEEGATVVRIGRALFGERRQL